MSMEFGTETVTIKSFERTARVQIETPYGAEPRIELFRETVREADKVVLSVSDWTRVTRMAKSVATETVILHSGMTLSALQVAEAIALFGDKWAAEDKVTAEVLPPPPPPLPLPSDEE